MARNKVLALVLLLAFALLPADAATEGVWDCLLSAVDAGAAVMAGRLLDPPPETPGVEVLMEGGLPRRAVLDDADLAVLVDALRPAAPPLAEIALCALSRSKRPPTGGLLAALCHKSLDARLRERGGSVRLSGTLDFRCSEGLESVRAVMLRALAGSLGDAWVDVEVDLAVGGCAPGREVRLEGGLELSSPGPRTVEIRLDEDFAIDGKKTGGGAIRYALDPFAWRNKI